MFKIYKIIVCWAIGVFVLSALGSWAFPKIANTGLGSESGNQQFSYYLSLAQWDGGNYIEIARNNYASSKYFAFAPLYPTVIRLLSQSTGLDYLLSGISISVISFLLFMYFFHKYNASLYGERHSKSILLTILFYPLTFFCLIIYTESLFLLLASLTIYSIIKKKYFTLLISSALLPLARFPGIFLTLGNIFIVTLHKKRTVPILLLLLSTIPFLVYLILLNEINNNPFAPIAVQGNWGRYAQDPFTTTFSYLFSLFSFDNYSLNNLFDLTTLIVFLVILLKNTKIIQPNLWIFSMLALLIPATTGTFSGMPRYALASLGVFIAVGIYLENHPKIKPVVWGLSLALQCLLFSLFINGHWIA